MTIAPSRTVRAVFFDLDDTLFDHQYSCRVALQVLALRYVCLQRATPEELERAHRDLLEDLHLLVIKGEMDKDEARIERFRRLFALYGGQVSVREAEDVVRSYRREYLHARRPIQGSRELLIALRGRDIRIAVVTNNIGNEQRSKMDVCGFAGLVDALVISAEVGVIKPDPAIFEIALQRVDCTTDETVMVGDNWISDIQGARQLGMRTVWLNRYNLLCPDPAHAIEIQSFEPLDASMRAIIG